jgi:hypothetical protein
MLPRSSLACTAGDQLAVGPVLIDLGGNPVGFAGTRQVRYMMECLHDNIMYEVWQYFGMKPRLITGLLDNIEYSVQ